MKTFYNSATCIIAAAVVTGCAAEPPKDTVEDMAPTAIVVDGQEYPVTRSLRTIDGKESEGWSVVVEGLAVACSEPTKLSCTEAVRGFSL